MLSTACINIACYAAQAGSLARLVELPEPKSYQRSTNDVLSVKNDEKKDCWESKGYFQYLSFGYMFWLLPEKCRTQNNILPRHVGNKQMNQQMNGGGKIGILTYTCYKQANALTKG